MAVTYWAVQKVDYCDIRSQNAALEVRLVQPADHLAVFGATRISGRRCSLDHECARMDGVQCVWVGTNPCVDPHRA